jgi:hypothetical protein
MARLNYETNQVSIVTLVNENLSAGDVIVIRTVGGVYDIKEEHLQEEHLLTGEFKTQPKEDIVSDNFPFARIRLKQVWEIKNGKAIPVDSFVKGCILHPHWSAAVKVRVGSEKESAESYVTVGVISGFEAGDIVTPRSLLTHEELIC